MFTKDDLIYAYTRRQAIRDGVLIDVSGVAKDMGFKYPVAMTAGAWASSKREGAWLREVLGRLRSAARSGRSDGPEVRFEVVSGEDAAEEIVTLRAVCGPDDDGSPCVTVMLVGED